MNATGTNVPSKGARNRLLRSPDIIRRKSPRKRVNSPRLPNFWQIWHVKAVLTFQAVKTVADRVIMVRPSNFGFNPETAGSNAFQRLPGKEAEEVTTRAVEEFEGVVDRLRGLGVGVLVFEDKSGATDAVFPNNWISTHEDGTVYLYPMEANSRRLERDPRIIETLELTHEMRLVDLTGSESSGEYLEGTGSLVLDRDGKVAYAARSTRTHPTALNRWCEDSGYESVCFTSRDSTGMPVYHTNVVMCIGPDFAVVCLESISDKGERAAVVESLSSTGKVIVEITIRQMENFAGNMILLQGDEDVLLMSKTARESLSNEQVERLSSFANLESVQIDMIETCGGGSVRCMIAENFLPRRTPV